MVPGAKARPVQEFLNALLYRPLAHLVVRLLLPTPVKPHHLVLFHTALVLLSAGLVLRGEDLMAALLLQLKTVLDNADGQLARLRGEVSEVGRYLDTEMDFLGNLALFLSLGARTGEVGLALLAFLAFTLAQSFDFNLERIYWEARGEARKEPPSGSKTPLLLLLRGLYALLFAPQDRAVRALECFLQGRLGLAPLRFWDEAALAGVVNLGLSTQLFFLGLFLALGQPRAYLTFVLLQALYLGAWYLWRIVRSIPSPR